MGIFLCETHGSSGIADVCEHVRVAVHEHADLADVVYWENTFLDYVWPHWLCRHCFQALRHAGLPDSGFVCFSEQDDTRIEAIFGQIAGVNDAVCKSCLVEWIAKTDAHVS